VPERYMTVDETARLLGRSERAIRWQIGKGAHGWFPGAIRDGARAWRIPSAEVDRRLELRSEVRILVSAERLIGDLAQDPAQLDEVTLYAAIQLAERMNELDLALAALPGAMWQAAGAQHALA
jgi:hypothetical protein